MSKAPHERALGILAGRCGRWSRVSVSGGRVCTVYDVAWGFDMGEDVAHITTNISPGPGVECVVDFFHANEIDRIEDSETGVVLFEHLVE